MITFWLVGLVVVGVAMGFWELRAVYGVGSVAEAEGMLMLPRRLLPTDGWTAGVWFVLAVNHDVTLMTRSLGRCQELEREECVTLGEINRRARNIRYNSLALLPRLLFTRAGRYTMAGLRGEYEELVGCFANLVAIREGARG